MSVRWSKTVARGLNAIYSLASNELDMHELSEMECACNGCTGPNEYHEPRDCHCAGKPLARQCDGCRTTHDWEEAIAWLGDQIDKHGSHQ